MKTSLIEKLENIFFEEKGQKRVLNRKLLRRLAWVFGGVSVVAVLLGEPKNTIQRKTAFLLETLPSREQTVAIPAFQESAAAVTIVMKKPLRQPARLPGPSLIHRPGANEILPGTIVRGRLQTSATDGPVKVVLEEDLLVDGSIKLPQGTVLIGKGQSLDSRVGIKFSKAIVSGSEVLSVKAVALDAEDQLVGLQASSVGGESVRLGASIGLNFVGGLAEGLKDRTGINGAIVEQSTPRNAFLNGASKATLEQARTLMEAQKNRKYSLMVEAGTPIFIFFNGED